MFGFLEAFPVSPMLPRFPCIFCVFAVDDFGRGGTENAATVDFILARISTGPLTNRLVPVVPLLFDNITTCYPYPSDTGVQGEAGEAGDLKASSGKNSNEHGVRLPR